MEETSNRQTSIPQRQSDTLSKVGRKNLKSACKNCKATKRKCSGGPPPCSCCKSLNYLCVFDETSDLRRTDAQERALNMTVESYQKLKFIVEILRSSDSPAVNSRVIELLRSGDRIDVDEVVLFIEHELGVSYQDVERELEP
ncbi:hypothetical protein H072_6970 [Dactylellina haptotyla CBS 200.50]|uniref:Zn(2)-C6 fungal-type domain-containing protein n=1 Tax=Dactylellina haptotyla (strain CBS 200.50) TaxID=1284197 RepID=S8A859_DACHA|nr:hypothetical protein H072_6970 [Dactylellina haptotyla CBS 200.50]